MHDKACFQIQERLSPATVLSEFPDAVFGPSLAEKFQTSSWLCRQLILGAIKFGVMKEGYKSKGSRCTLILRRNDSNV